MKSIEFDITIFLLGCIGAFAPEVIRLYNLRNNPEEFTWSPFYIIVTILYVPLGGVVAWVLPAISYWGALYAGVAAPTIVNTMIKNTTSAEPPQPPQKLKVMEELERETIKGDRYGCGSIVVINLYSILGILISVISGVVHIIRYSFFILRVYSRAL